MCLYFGLLVLGVVWGEEVLERWALVFGMYFIFWLVVCYVLFVEIECGLGWSGGVLFFWSSEDYVLGCFSFWVVVLFF